MTDPICTDFVTSGYPTISTPLWMDEVERTSSTGNIAVDHPLSLWTAPFEPASNGMPSAHDNLSPIVNVHSKTHHKVRDLIGFELRIDFECVPSVTTEHVVYSDPTIIGITVCLNPPI